MTSVTEFRGDLVSVTPVEGCLVSTSEEVGGVSGQGDGCNGTHNLGLTLDKHAAAIDLGNRAVTSSDKQVTVGQLSDYVDTLGEETLSGANSLVELANKVNLNNVSSESSEVST